MIINPIFKRRKTIQPKALILLLSSSSYILQAIAFASTSTCTNHPSSKQATPETLQEDMAIMKNPFSKYYPSNWPKNPFHAGEIKMQQQAGVQELVMSYAPRVVRPYLPEQHSDFYEGQPFLVVAARDGAGQMWATLLTSPTGRADMITSLDPVTLRLVTSPVRGDALEGSLKEGVDLGILGIEFATKRRNRVNGRITKTASTDQGPVIIFSVDQSFGNCPQYIKPRQWWTRKFAADEEMGKEQLSTTPDHCLSLQNRTSELTPRQIELIGASETVLIATGYRGKGEDVRFGNDASHRGGPAGFLKVIDSKTLILAEFAGNNHFNSLGNLQLDPRLGITIPFWEDGGMLQLTGTATVDTDHEKAGRAYPGALRLVTFNIEQVNQVQAGSLAVRWSAQSESDSRQLHVTSIVQETANVKSFHLKPLPQDAQDLWEFTAGQHLPIQLRTPFGELLRTYSLSSSPLNNYEYRISVKRESLGKASTYLHDFVGVGDILQVSRPAGDFTLAKTAPTEVELNRTLVLLSNGIGVTPILSMLHQYVANRSIVHWRNVFWIHGARNSVHHPFRGEVEGLVRQMNGHVTSHIVYSRSLPSDTFDSQGHINFQLVRNLVPDLGNADIYMCGNAAFMGYMEDSIEKAGLDPKCVFFETF